MDGSVDDSALPCKSRAFSAVSAPTVSGIGPAKLFMPAIRHLQRRGETNAVVPIIASGSTRTPQRVTVCLRSGEGTCAWRSWKFTVRNWWQPLGTVADLTQTCPNDFLTQRSLDNRSKSCTHHMDSAQALPSGPPAHTAPSLAELIMELRTPLTSTPLALIPRWEQSR